MRSVRVSLKFYLMAFAEFLGTNLNLGRVKNAGSRVRELASFKCLEACFSTFPDLPHNSGLEDANCVVARVLKRRLSYMLPRILMILYMQLIVREPKLN